MAYDPIAMPAARAVLPAAVGYAAILEAALDAVDAALLVTRWAEFARLPALLAALPQPPLLVDGRRMIEPAEVARYDAIGR